MSIGRREVACDDRPLRRAIESHLGSGDVARVIYGSIIGLALVVALQDHPPSAATMASFLVGTAVAVGLAEVYSEYVGAEARTRRPVETTQLRQLLVDAAAVMFGAGFPAVFFVLAAAGALDIDVAFRLAKWSGLGLICAYAFVAARLAGAGRAGALVHAALLGVVGGALIALKSLLH
jgi:ABC-type microcin C transport system permease subunit YejB